MHVKHWLRFVWAALLLASLCLPASATSYRPVFHFDPLHPNYTFDWARIAGDPDPHVQDVVPQSWSSSGKVLLCAEFYGDAVSEVIKSLVLLDLEHQNSHRIFVSNTKELVSEGIAYTWDASHTYLYYQMRDDLPEPFVWRWDTQTGRYQKLSIRTQKHRLLRSLGVDPATKALLIGLEDQVYEIDTTKSGPYSLKQRLGMQWSDLDSFARYHRNDSPVQITQEISNRGRLFKQSPYLVTVFPFPQDPNAVAVADSERGTLSVYQYGQPAPVSQIALPSFSPNQLPPSALRGVWSPRHELVFTAKHLFQAHLQDRKIQSVSPIAHLPGEWEAAQTLFSPQGTYLAYFSIWRSQARSMIDVLKATPSLK